MSLLCNTGHRRGYQNNNCGCGCGCDNTQVAGTTTEEQPVRVQAMLQSVIDSCCQTDDITREITVPCGFFDPEDLEVGAMVNVDIDGDITFREVSRDKDDCNCVSSVRFQIPLSISPLDSCGKCNKVCIERVVTAIRTVELCCTKDSMLLAANTKVLSANAWISEINCDNVRICIEINFRSCLQQTVMRQYEFEATPVCTHPNCADVRNSFVDNCDMTCGCVASAKKCAMCNS